MEDIILGLALQREDHCASNSAFADTDVRDTQVIFIVPHLTFPPTDSLIFLCIRAAKQDPSDAFGWLASLHCV